VAASRIVLLACTLGVLAGAHAGDGESPARFLGRTMPYDAFDELSPSRLEAGGATLRIAYPPGPAMAQEAAVREALRKSARTIAHYFGRFPVDTVRVLVVPLSGDQIHGTSWGYRGAAMRLRIGRDAGEEAVKRNWVMTHEMVHLALPSLPDEQDWLDEGLATYVEGVARAQLGDVPLAQLWGGFVKGMPKGLPQAGDRGLDHTHTWGRTYWGGALFCLLADVEIRQRTHNARGLREALRGVVAQGGNREQEWPVERFLSAGDAATGVPVLRELYERMKDTPVQVDLPALWTRLGIVVRQDGVSFDDSAPLASVRKGITAR
jgi:hypothetical protein